MTNHHRYLWRVVTKMYPSPGTKAANRKAKPVTYECCILTRTDDLHAELDGMLATIREVWDGGEDEAKLVAVEPVTLNGQSGTELSVVHTQTEPPAVEEGMGVEDDEVPRWAWVLIALVIVAAAAIILALALAV